jgi:hypothetical protein
MQDGRVIPIYRAGDGGCPTLPKTMGAKKLHDNNSLKTLPKKIFKSGQQKNKRNQMLNPKMPKNAPFLHAHTQTTACAHVCACVRMSARMWWRVRQIFWASGHLSIYLL